jgi:hypothetical protein
MLELLRDRSTREAPNTANRLTTRHASAFDTTIPATTDLVVTHFLLDCFTQHQVEALAHHVASHVQPGCLWLVSDFAIPSHSLLRPLAAAYIRALYFAFRLLTGLRVTHLPDPQRALSAAGFVRIERFERCAGFLYTELWRPSLVANP